MYITKCRILWQDSAAIITKLSGNLLVKHMFESGSVRLSVVVCTHTKKGPQNGKKTHPIQPAGSGPAVHLYIFIPVYIYSFMDLYINN